MVSTSVAESDFAIARMLINKQKPKINYDEFCRGRLDSGLAKSACRIAEMPRVVFLFCNNYGAFCEPQIVDPEIKNLRKLYDNGVRTVKFDEDPIKKVKCAKSSDLNCAGFLEEWIDKNVGQHYRLDRYFRSGTVGLLIEKIRKQITTPDGRKETADDLKKIKEYMVAPQRKYHLICDLQGFFLSAGGFLVNDPEDIKENVNLHQKCEIDTEREPTTKQVLDGLELLIQDLRE